MKGLLHRLAERAAGTAASLRPDARLPYASVPPVAAPIQDDDVTPAGHGGLSPRSAAGQAPTWRGTPSSRMPETAAKGTSQLAGTDTDGAFVGPTPLVDQASAAAPAPTPQFRTRPPPDAPATHTTREAHAFALSPSLPARRPAAEEVGRNPLPWAEPTRLVAPSSPAEAVPMPSLRPSASPVQATAEPTEVHVHIGRIEVTAVHEPPAPRRPAPPRAAPVSLQAYLATKGKS